MKKRVWKPWTLVLGSVLITRELDGRLLLRGGTLSRASARRLYQKLSGDYRD